jgi:dihydroxyacetone kinase
VSGQAVTVGPADEDARRAAAVVVAAIEAMAGVVAEAEEELGRIDAVAGDGDHGRGMVRGSAAALEAARRAHDAGGGPDAVLGAAGDAWAEKAGGTSGVLWGAALGAVGRRLGDVGTPAPDAVAAAVRDGYDTLVKVGGAKPGDKTMLDALLPFTESLSAAVASGEPLLAAWTRAAEESAHAARATAQLRPQVGRARPLAERSLGTPDAGAVSMALCLRAVARVLAAGSDSTAVGSEGMAATRKDEGDG